MRQHPLEPLSADEFRQTASILRSEGLVRDTFRFASIELMEPPKGEVKAWRPGDTVRRTSFAVVFDREDNKTYEATVDLTGHVVVSFEHVPDVTPNFTLDEFHDVDVAMRQHPDVIAKLAARGFTDMSLILVDVWTYGKAVMPEQHRQRRLGFNYREGPVIYQVTFDDRGTVRDIAYRLSFAEMIVPYRDPTFDHYRRTAYDIGEWGLGVMTKSLELGCDCLGEVTYLDATLCDSKGDPYDIPHAICLHEEDNAVLWKHVDPHTGAEIRRQRRMVVSSHASVANYEYLIYWRFYQDGNIECEVRATGLMVTTPYPAGGQPPPYGTVVDTNTYAPYHQHFLIARLDLDIDGDANTVMETDSAAPPVSEDNPYGLALVTRSTPVRSEAESARDYDWSTQRGWSVVNPNKVNKYGTNVGYKLVPGGCFPVLMDPAAPQYLRAPVIGHNLWVTEYSADERWPAGAYPTQSAVDTGITEWIKDDASLENTDVVLWYVFGLHHITRVEEWPVMPVDVVSFWLKPSGFFNQNPSLDAAPMERDEDGTCHT
jgi:primary-amine oxidase